MAVVPVDTLASTAPSVAVRARVGRDERLLHGLLLVYGLFFLAVLVLPLYVMLSKSFENKAGEFVGLANYALYFASPALSQSIWNSLFVSAVSAVITILLAFVYAYGVTRTAIPFKGLFRGVAFLPILAPSLLPGISLVYLFGNQGMLKGMLLGGSIYGPLGIVAGEVFYCFPHAFLIISTALSLADSRLYEAATSLGASRPKVFWTVTLPGVKYGLISAAFVVFTLVITDFGVPKVIGGAFNVLATDIYKQVVGQANFQMGAVVSVLLLLPRWSPSQSTGWCSDARWR
jgi:iron(III) transport system permease protein